MMLLRRWIVWELQLLLRWCAGSAAACHGMWPRIWIASEVQVLQRCATGSAAPCGHLRVGTRLLGLVVGLAV